VAKKEDVVRVWDVEKCEMVLPPIDDDDDDDGEEKRPRRKGKG